MTTDNEWAGAAKLGLSARERQYFEPDTEFLGDLALRLVQAYERASGQAATTARNLVRHLGDDEAPAYMHQADQAETIAATLEQVLLALPHRSMDATSPGHDRIDLPRLRR